MNGGLTEECCIYYVYRDKVRRMYDETVKDSGVARRVMKCVVKQ